MNDDQLQAWLDQHGGETGRKDNEKDVEDGSINPNTGAPGKKRTVDTTTITAKDGATLTLRRDTSGSGTTYQVIENTPPKPAAATAGTEVTRAAEAKAKREREESEANAALPPDQDPRYETNEARAKRAQDTIKQQGADAVAADERARRDRLDQEARDAKAKADAAANRPKDGRESIRGKDGKPYVKVTKVDPASGKSEVYYENEAGQRVPPPEEKPADIADPTDMPAPTFVVGDAAKDLRDFDVYLAGKIGTGPGKITQAKADQLRENRRKLWDIALTEQQGLVNTQKAEADRRGNERGQTLSDQGNRRSNATSIANQATSSLLPYMDKMGANANGADFVAALRYLRDSSQDFVTSTGANAYVPNVTPGPALTTINNAAIPAPGSAPAASFLSPTRPAAAATPAFTPQPVAPPPAGPSQAAAAQAAQRGASGAAEPTPGVNPGPAPVVAPVPAFRPGAMTDSPQDAAIAPDSGMPPVVPTMQEPDGNERLDDILTVMGPDGSQMEMPRHEYNSHPAQGQLRVTNARPAAPSVDGGFVFEPGYRPAPPVQYPYNVPGDPNYDPTMPHGYMPTDPNMVMMKSGGEPGEWTGEGASGAGTTQQYPVRKPRWRGEGAPGAGTPQQYPVVPPDMTGRGTETAPTPDNAPYAPSRTQGEGVEPWPSYTQGTGFDPMTVTPSGSPRSMPGAVYDGGPMMPSRTQSTGFDPNAQMMPRTAPFLTPTRGPQQRPAYDPMPSVQSMIDDPEWDNEAVQQAYFEMYGKRLPMSA